MRGYGRLTRDINGCFVGKKETERIKLLSLLRQILKRFARLYLYHVKSFAPLQLNRPTREFGGRVSKGGFGAGYGIEPATFSLVIRITAPLFSQITKTLGKNQRACSA